MKIIILTVLIMPQIIFAQSKIEGLGLLKLHTTLKTAKEMLYAQYSVSNYGGDDNNLGGDSNVVELHGDYSDDSSNLHVYVYLSFFKDTLYEIHVFEDNVGNADLYQAFKMKHGKGKASGRNYIILCRCLCCATPTKYPSYDSTYIWKQGKIYSKMELSHKTVYANGGCNLVIDKSLDIKDMEIEKRRSVYLTKKENERKEEEKAATLKLMNKL